ncbi:MAG TPA: hypothetical protein P5346_02480 [Spirochaetota bacterium]|nr:hypothetical protein [Spirochaetota bacterium]HSA13583.1 hypothetical protein [Spirochaetota bacterium]
MKKMALLFFPALISAFLMTACDDGGGGGGKGSHAWTEANSTPFLYTRFDAEYSYETGRVYFLGGRCEDYPTETTVGYIWEYDPATGDYNSLPPVMTTPVSNYTIARLTDGNGREVFVIFGGRNNSGDQVPTVQCFYPDTLTVTSLPVGDNYTGMGSPGVAVVDNKAYVFGGVESVGHTASANTYIFDITASSGSRWTAGPALNLARGYIAAAAVDGIVYAMGGDIYDGSSLVAQTMVEKLDPTDASPAWNDVDAADLPFACDETQAFGFDSDADYRYAGSIIVAGCGRWSSEYEYSLRYDAGSNTWYESFPDLNQARRNHAGAFIPEGEGAGRPGIWVWGGRQGSDYNLLGTPEYY